MGALHEGSDTGRIATNRWRGAQRRSGKISLKEEVHANIKVLLGDETYTLDDRALLAEFSAKALGSEVIKRMRVD